MNEIESFIGRLRDRPWIEPALVDLIAHGLQTAVRDPNPVLWGRLHEVICDDDATVEHQLRQIGRLTKEHFDNERARRAAH
jgi:hypothetical protein